MRKTFSDDEVYERLMRKIAASTDPDSLRMTIDEVVAYIPMKRGQLAQLRFRGTGPKFLKPSPRTVLYLKKDIDEWLMNSVHATTDEVD